MLKHQYPIRFAENTTLHVFLSALYMLIMSFTCHRMYDLINVQQWRNFDAFSTAIEHTGFAMDETKVGLLNRRPILDKRAGAGCIRHYV